MRYLFSIFICSDFLFAHPLSRASTHLQLQEALFIENRWLFWHMIKSTGASEDRKTDPKEYQEGLKSLNGIAKASNRLGSAARQSSTPP